MSEITVRADRLKLNDIVYMTLYGLSDHEDGYEEVEIIEIPENGIQRMNSSERLKVRITETNEVIEFRRNACKPYFLVTDIVSKKNQTKLERVKFWKNS